MMSVLNCLMIFQFFERGFGNVPASQYSTMRIPLLSDSSVRPPSSRSQVLPDYPAEESTTVLPEKRKSLNVPEESGYGAGIGRAE
jgi:hypothetical protein